MKLIGVEAAKATQVFIAEEVRPFSGSYYPESARLLTERYGFATSPTPNEAISGGAKFTNGRLIAGTRRVNIFDLVVYSNGIQVTTQTNTADADYVIEDALAWSMGTLGLRDLQTNFPRLYESALVVEFERDPDRLLSSMRQLTNKFQSSLETLYGLRSSVHVASFGIAVDPIQVIGELPPPLPGVLKNELGLVRRIYSPYSVNRFYSLAPLPTDLHRDFLEEFERAIPD